RCFVLLVADGTDGGRPLGYLHRRPYVRLSSVAYSNSPRRLADRFVHLTNDAVQKKSEGYGKHEPGNKASSAEAASLAIRDWRGASTRPWVEDKLFPTMRSLAATSVAAVRDTINAAGRRRCFELLGYDFMV
ncbi:unnamed protein product, partial [Phaeothamnion confervicola]